MKNKELLDIYGDYLMGAFGQTTGTGLAGLLGNSFSHDRIQRLLAQEWLGLSNFGRWRTRICSNLSKSIG